MSKLIEEAIANLDCLISDHNHHGVPAPGWMEAAVEALRDYRQAENPPLAIDELYQMDGEPVWIDDWYEDFHGWEFSEDAADYVEGRNVKSYGSSWVAYRHKPTDQKPAADTPLTLEELRSDDFPFWVKSDERFQGDYYPAIKDTHYGVEVAVWCSDEHELLKFSDYGETWTAYRSKPKEVSNGN